ncbi:MAG TPA: isochorismatase family cysteine hydrolase [Victivallales bacterium]|nr:isochorismatase family cysteine hydrolase [Victivallales bacterium]
MNKYEAIESKNQFIDMALVILDMQNDAMDIVPTGKSVIPTIQTVLNTCRQKNIQVIHKKRVHREDGIDVERFRIKLFNNKPFVVEGTHGAKIINELKPIKGEAVVIGTRFSGFFQTDLQQILTRLGIKTLIVCGIQTPNCIRATITNAIAYDYDVILLRDATAAQTPEIHEANIIDIKNMGVSIMTSSEFFHSLEQVK